MSKNLYFIVVTVWLIAPVFLCAQNIDNMNDTAKTSMTPDKNEVRTFSKDDGYTLMADLNELDDNAVILFFDRTCTIIGLDYIPRALYCGPNLNPSKLPEYIQKNFNDIRVVIFETRLGEDNKKVTFSKIPDWIIGMPNLEYITFNGIKIDKQFFTAGLPIKHLVIEGILSTDKKIIFKHIDKLKSLQYLVHKNIFTADEIASIERKVPRLIMLSEREYDAKLDSGEIPLPDWSKKND